MSNVLKDSWNNFNEEYAKEYLKYFPKNLHTEAVLDIFSSKDNPSVIDIGCGNCQLYNTFSEFKKPFIYTGIDWSIPLLESYKCNNQNFSVINGDILDNQSYLDKKYDAVIISHVVELVSSPEKLLKIASNLANKIYIVWYEYPRIEDSIFEVRNYVNSFNESKNIISPYLRSKISKDYWSFILQKNNLKVLKESYMSEKDVLTILETKKR
jgi:SAM-dependent methyltransferase